MSSQAENVVCSAPGKSAWHSFELVKTRRINNTAFLWTSTLSQTADAYQRERQNRNRFWSPHRRPPETSAQWLQCYTAIEDTASGETSRYTPPRCRSQPDESWANGKLDLTHYFRVARHRAAIVGNRQWIAIPLLLPAKKFQFGTYESPGVPCLTLCHLPEQANCAGTVVMIETPVPDAIARCVEGDLAFEILRSRRRRWQHRLCRKLSLIEVQKTMIKIFKNIGGARCS